MTIAPTIETRRLRLRAHTVDDWPACAAMWSDPTVVRFIGGQPSSPQQTWARVIGYAGHWALLGFGYWAVTDKVSGRYIGEAGCADFKRDIAASMRHPEAGWAFVPTAHGKGFATEALTAVTAWADAHLAVERTVCLIDSDNVASIRVARKCGYVPFDSAFYGARPTQFFARQRAAR